MARARRLKAQKEFGTRGVWKGLHNCDVYILGGAEASRLTVSLEGDCWKQPSCHRLLEPIAGISKTQSCPCAQGWGTLALFVALADFPQVAGLGVGQKGKVYHLWVFCSSLPRWCMCVCLYV